VPSIDARSVGAAGNSKSRGLGVLDSSFIVVGSIVGGGIFFLSNDVAANVASPAGFLGMWLVGGVVALAGALSNGELGGLFPRSGGEYVYLREAYGAPVGFLSGWTSFWVGFPASIAALAWGLGRTLAPMLHLAGDSAPKWVGLVAILLLTAINALGLHAGKWTQNVLTVTKLVAFGGLLLVGVLVPGGGAARQAEPFFARGDTALGLGAALVSVSFAYSGWNAATYVAGEMRDPRRGLGRALGLGTGLCILLYVAINAVYLRAMPLSALRAAKAPAQAAAEILGGPAAASVLSPLIVVCVLSSLQATVLVGPRIYHAMATDGLFLRPLGRLDPRTGVPLVSLLLQGAISILELVTGGFERLVGYSVFAIGAFSTLTVAAVIVLRLRRPELERAFPVPGYPFLPLLFVLVNIWVLWSLLSSDATAALVGLAIVATGAPAYAVFRRLDRPR
jgi:APA family basic amino acid/polyamine antiporter